MRSVPQCVLFQDELPPGHMPRYDRDVVVPSVALSRRGGEEGDPLTVDTLCEGEEIIVPSLWPQLTSHEDNECFVRMMMCATAKTEKIYEARVLRDFFARLRAMEILMDTGETGAPFHVHCNPSDLHRFSVIPGFIPVAEEDHPCVAAIKARDQTIADWKLTSVSRCPLFYAYPECPQGQVFVQSRGDCVGVYFTRDRLIRKEFGIAIINSNQIIRLSLLPE